MRCSKVKTSLKDLGNYFFSYYFLPNKNIYYQSLTRKYHKTIKITNPPHLNLIGSAIPFKTNYVLKFIYVNHTIRNNKLIYVRQTLLQGQLLSFPTLQQIHSYNMTYQPSENDKVEKILLQLNKTGLSYLKYLQFEEAIDFFKKAEKIVNEEMMLTTKNQKMNQLAGVTYNNLACYYKKTKRPKVALNYLKKSLEIQVYKISDWVSTGSTHLNICAIYSYINKHQEALSHAKLAIQLLEKKQYNIADGSEQAKSYWNIKMLCYYNMAIEEEYLKMYEASLASYSKAKDIAKVFGSKNVGIVLNCDQAISRIETILATLKKKMINIFMKKKEDEEQGHYQYMRHHKLITKNDQKIFSHEKLQKLSTYQSVDTRKKISVDTKMRGKPDAVEIIQRRSNSSKFKSLNDYLSQKYKTQPQSAKEER